MALLVVLVRRAARLKPTVAAGRIKYLTPPVPPLGSQPSLREKRMINIRPSQKLGVDTPKRATTVAAVSFQVFS